jgi:hypothetical protein
MLEDHRPGEMANRQSVGLSLIVYIIGSYQISRPGHVLNDGAGISGNVFSNMTRGYPAVSVETSARGGADNKNKSLSFVEFLSINRGGN